MENLMGFTFYDWLIETGDLGVGPGLWCPLHIILMVALAGWLVACWFIFKKYRFYLIIFFSVIV